MTPISTHLFRGAIAGAVGTAALNATTHLDMAIRGRPSSSTPEQVVEQSAELLGLNLPDDAEERQARQQGLGALLGTAAGIASGVVLGGLRATGRPRSTAGAAGAAWALAMVAGNGPMVVLGVSDPRSWSTADWLADLIPHGAYALAATATLHAFETAGSD